MKLLFTHVCLKCRNTLSRTFFTKMSQDRLLLSSDARSALEKKLNIFRDLGLSEELINKKRFVNEVSKLEPEKLIIIVELIKSLGLAKEDIVAFPKILSHNPHIIDRRFKVLEEGGFRVKKITIPTILNFWQLRSTSVNSLKERGLVDKQINVTRSILSYCDLPSNLYPQELNELQMFNEIQAKAIESYLSWEFNLTSQEIQKLSNPHNILNLKSIRLILESYDLLISNVGLSKDMIRQNLYLLLYYPARCREVLERLPLVGTLPVRDVIKTHPKLILRPSLKLLETLSILKKFKIPPSSLNLNFDILALSPETVRKRLEYFQNDPNFQSLLHHPRICRAVVYFNQMTKRFDQLHDSNWRTRTLEMLSAQSKVFQGRLKMGSDVSRGCDIVHYLHKEMKLKRKVVRTLLQQNPFWCCVPVVTVTSTLKLLREAGFDSSLICAALPVILYPKDEVSKWLELVESQPEVDCCRDPATGLLQPGLILPLVLYFLERPFHFSGNGIWDTTKTATIPDNSPDHTSLIDHSL